MITGSFIIHLGYNSFARIRPTSDRRRRGRKGFTLLTGALYEGWRLAAGKAVCQPVAQAREVLGGQIVPGVRVEEDTRAGRELIVPFPKKDGHGNARESLKTKTGIGEVKGLAALAGRSRAESGQILTVALSQYGFFVAGERLGIEEAVRAARGR